MQRLPVDFDGAIGVENHYDFEDLASVRFDWELARFDFDSGGHTSEAAGSTTTGSIGPGESGSLELELPSDWRSSHALFLSATDRSDRSIGTWSWMIPTQTELRAELVDSTGAAAVQAMESDSSLGVFVGDTEFEFGKDSGRLVRVRRGDVEFPLANGPVLSVGEAALTSFSSAAEGDGFTITATYEGDLEEVRWHVHPSGWLSLAYRYTLSGSFEYFGIDFECPEASVQGVDWLGKGPSRVWRNRIKGVWHDLWTREKNDAVTGQLWQYPEFKGYFADLYWSRIRTSAGPIVVVSGTPDLFLRLYRAARRHGPTDLRHGLSEWGYFLPSRHRGHRRQVFGSFQSRTPRPALRARCRNIRSRARLLFRRALAFRRRPRMRRSRIFLNACANLPFLRLPRNRDTEKIRALSIHRPCLSLRHRLFG